MSKKQCVGVMELADVTDSKSVDGDIVWVRVPPPAPLDLLIMHYELYIVHFYRNGEVSKWS